MLGVRNPLNFPSCVYVWVMNHLRVVFGDVFLLFWVFGWIYGKMDKISKSGQFRGPMLRRRDPTQQRKSTPRCGMPTSRRGRDGGLDKPQVHRGIAKLRRSLAVLRHGVALFTNMCFCHVLLFRYSKDLSIGLMRTL